MQVFHFTKISTRPQRAHKHTSRKTGKTKTTGNWTHPEYEYKDEVLEGTVTLEIDVEALLRVLGTKALQSKSRKAVEASGAIRVTATSVKVAVPGNWMSWEERKQQSEAPIGIKPKQMQELPAATNQAIG
ncbi:MAG TPA: hypothetical protein VH164_08135 [Ktedonobacteraceae bacterium]|jgi:hypothetical protein|nr:hypothetical protein [Ktedonobacteraceae bacterium]